ncbi:hypothetical protein [Chromobacterium subtsugae]|uniref:hypothetical protein n=1 Tax=Chromobacterium subtsugae TaxID=251747 RepID=UPI000A5D5021|nr:hypothetical protein [Chromobacterium subtsugae]
MLTPALSAKPVASAPRIADAAQASGFVRMLTEAQSDAPAPKAAGKLNLENLSTD